MTPGVRDLLASAGHSLSPAVAYRSQRELQAILADLAHRGSKIIVSHIPAHNLLCPESYMVSPALQIELNHKANLPRFVPSKHVLPRHCISVTALGDAGEALGNAVESPREPPVVLKSATRLPTGGGFAVVICKDHHELRGGLAMFQQAASTADGVIVEEFRDFERTWCAQVVIDDSRVVYLGAAAQVCSAEGRYLGNLCGTQHEAPAGIEPLAVAIGSSGQAAGYRGFAGFDIGVDKQGQLWVFDLNFRVCGSLAQLLFHASMCRDPEHAVTRNLRLDSPLDVSDMALRLRPFIDDRVFVPIAALDGPAVGNSTSIVVGYAVASSTAAVEDLRRLLHLRCQ
jgi:hypothetical protein